MPHRPRPPILHQRVAERREQSAIDRIAVRLMFGMPLHAERKAWRVGETMASMVSSSAMPSMTMRWPGSRMPWPCSELTRIVSAPSSLRIRRRG